MASDDNPLMPFFEGPASILGTFLFFGISAIAGQLIYFIAYALADCAFSEDSISWNVPGDATGLVFFLFSVPAVPIFACMTGIGFFFFGVDVVCVFRRIYTEISWHAFFFRISGAQISCFLSTWIVFEGCRDPNTYLTAFAASFAVLGLAYWLTRRWGGNDESNL